jgi:hypothetical protein
VSCSKEEDFTGSQLTNRRGAKLDEASGAKAQFFRLLNVAAEAATHKATKIVYGEIFDGLRFSCINARRFAI